MNKTQKDRTLILVHSNYPWIKIANNEGYHVSQTYRNIGVVNIFHDSDPVKNSLWKHNLISFRDGTLAQVLTQLSRIYGVDFVLQGEIPDYKLTFTTEKESLSHILEELELISSLTFSFTSDKVVTVTNE